MSVDFFDRLPKFDALHIPFPNPPSVTQIEGYNVYKYVSPERMNIAIRRFSEVVKLKAFDVVLVNQIGGDYFAKKLAELQVYRTPMFNIEYHRDGRVVIPIPKLSSSLKVGIVDDIYDEGNTATRMLKDAPNATCLFLTEKVRVPGQLSIPKRFSALLIDNVWVGGCGLNLEGKGDGLPKDFARDYPGLVVKIQQ